MLELIVNVWHRLFNRVWNPFQIPLCSICGRKMERLSIGYKGIMLTADQDNLWGCYKCALLTIRKRTLTRS